MATTVTKVIDPDSGSGYDYDSLYDWEAAQQGDLTGARDEIAVAKCRCTGGTADTTIIEIDGWTVSATQYIKIWTDPTESYRHGGIYPSGNKYRMYLNGGAGVGVNLVEPYTQFIGIAIHLHSYANVALRIGGSGAGWATIKDCVVKGAGIATSTGIATVYEGSGSGSGSNIINNIVYDFTNGIQRGAVDQVCAIYNNTVHNCTTGFYSASTNFLLKNNIAQDCTTCYSSTFNSNSTNNCSDDNTQPGSNGRNGEVSFVDEANDDFHLASDDSVALGYGANLYNDATYSFQDDIDGNDRGGSGASWDIGADEYVSTVVNPNVSDSITITDVVTVDNSTVPLAASDTCAVSEEINISLSIEVSIFDEIELVEDIINASDSIISTYDELSISEYTDNLVSACVLDTYSLVTVNEYSIVYTIQLGTVVWGHDTGVEESVVKNFQGNWTGTGSIGGSDDEEILEIGTGTYMESENIQLGAGNVVIALNKYRSGTLFPVRKYKTAAVEEDLAGLGWSNYTDQFYCEGWVKIRLEAA